MSRICVVGSGYVGTTLAAILSVAGFQVTAIDVDENKVERIKTGRAPFFEEGLNNLIREGLDSGNLKISNSSDPLKNADFIFSCVGTPDNPDGSINLEYVTQVAKSVAMNAKAGAVLIQKSTVPVGTGENLSQIVKNQIYVSNPEFLRESTAVYDSLVYDRIVIGCNHATTSRKLADLFKAIYKKRQHIAEIANIKNLDKITSAKPGQVIFTSVKSAELIKVTANAFLALKISFANSIAKLADSSGADIIEVMKGVGADTRIGTAFLNAGRGYGGGCFPKDVKGLISVAIDYGVDLSIMQSAVEVNESMPGYIVNKVKKQSDLSGKKVAVLGLAFKAGTSDTRKSPAVSIANLLDKLGAKVHVYDPEANGEAKLDLRQSVTIEDELESAVRSAYAIFVATDWRHFLNMEPKSLKDKMSGNIFVDCMNAFDRTKISDSGFRYFGVGR